MNSLKIVVIQTAGHQESQNRHDDRRHRASRALRLRRFLPGAAALLAHVSGAVRDVLGFPRVGFDAQSVVRALSIRSAIRLPLSHSAAKLSSPHLHATEYDNLGHHKQHFHSRTHRKVTDSLQLTTRSRRPHRIVGRLSGQLRLQIQHPMMGFLDLAHCASTRLRVRPVTSILTTRS